MDCKFALYLAVNKDTDELYGEIVKLDKVYANMHIDKAGRIIVATTAPQRLNENPSWYECKFCNYTDICHGQEVPEVSCRSCTYSSPAQDKTWFCDYHSQFIPHKYESKHCKHYKVIT